MRTPVSEQFGIERPIFAFSHSPAVVAAVSRAGGMGVFGALSYTPDQLREHLNWIDDNVEGKPYGVDVVMPASYAGADLSDPEALLGELEKMIPEEYRAFVADLLDGHGTPSLPEDATEPRGLLGWTRATAMPQVEIALEHPIALLANALGPPPQDVVEQAHDKDVRVAALVGHVDHAKAQVEAGVDIVVAVGTEAAGHTGEISTLVLVPQVVDAVSPTPVLAAGGIGNGRQMAASLALGAAGVWTGSIWLTVEETDVPSVVVEKLLAATSRDTIRTRAMTGKPARLLKSGWTEAWEANDSPDPLPMPLQFLLTAEAQHRIFRDPGSDLLTFPVGQIVGTMNDVRSVAEVMESMTKECEEAAGAVERILES
jgi:NAD(P)H-dependent flavin oxidoreductase YrpB (nitropropane dioxygenase family)